MRSSLRAVLLIGTLYTGMIAQQAPPAVQVTARGWKRLRSSAKTPEEFRQCAQWCRTQADSYRRKQGEYEAELKALAERPPHRIGPKYPPNPEHLRTKIDHYRGLTQHWTNLADEYDRRAADQ